MNSFIALIALVATVSAGPAFDIPEMLHQSMFPGSRIVGGEDAHIVDVPYQVSLQVFNDHYCGASIISENWIITAAHCVRYSPSDYTVRAGSDFEDNGGYLHDVEKIIAHPLYNETSRGVPSNDIALIRVSQPITFDETKKPIQLYEQDEDTEVGVLGTLSGWGKTGHGHPRQLQMVKVPTVSKMDCRNAYGSIPDGQICAAYPEGGKDTCKGDSGGPFAINGRLAGVVSWGQGCGVKGYPGVNTEVAYHRDWIRKNSGV